MVNISLPVCPGKFHLYQCTNSKACKYLRLCDIFDRFCPYTTATSTATLSSAHQISENSDQQQPQQRPAIKSWWWLRLPEPIHGKFGQLL